MSNEVNMEKYSQMTSEALEALLRQDLDASEQEQLDADTILLILNILEERNGKLELNSQRAWEEFQTLYLDVPQERKVKRSKLRRMLVLAATITLMGAMLLNAGAQRGSRQKEVVATWGEGTFRFEETVQRDIGETCPRMEEHLSKETLDALFMPTWIPENYTIIEDGREIDFFGLRQYRNYDTPEKLYLICCVEEFLPGTTHCVNDELEELYHYKGQDYYLFYNVNRPVAIWYRDGYVGRISGNISMKELKQMIHSIGKGE